MEDPDLKELLLGSYVSSYLEEEVRQEGIVRKLGTFIRFLELAAAESGKVINYSNISQDLNVATQTVIGYFEILVDCLVAERITPYLEKDTRKRFIKAPKFLFFDTGVRRIAAKEGTKPTKESFGAMFEQFVGLELLRNMRLKSPRASLQFWRSHDGPEVDWLVPVNDSIIPVEVKWSDSPHPHDAKHVSFFLENFKTAELGYVVCRVPRRQKLADNVIAIPWQEIETITT
jgi:predicted AAA+ superfamily ATPase